LIYENQDIQAVYLYGQKALPLNFEPTTSHPVN